MKINERIQKIQKELNLSQEEFCRITGVSVRAMRSWYYRGSIPGGDALEKILRRLPQININYLMLEQNPPILYESKALHLKRKFSEEDDEIFREVSYKQFVFLFENTKSPKLNHDIYRAVEAEGFVGKAEKRIGLIFGDIFDAFATALRRTPLDILTEFYAKHLYVIVRGIAARKPLEPIETYILCRIGRMTPNELNVFDQILCPPDDIDEFRRKIDTSDKFLLMIYEEERLSGRIIKKNNLWKFVQIAYRQLAISIRKNEFPNYCNIHEKLHWTLDCPKCLKR